MEPSSDAPGDCDIQTTLKTIHGRAEQGDAVAQFTLGESYQYGNGVKADDREALKWYLRAAQGGEVPALYKLMQMSEEGRISEEDIKLPPTFSTEKARRRPGPHSAELAAANSWVHQLAAEKFLLQLIATAARPAMDRYLDSHKDTFSQQQVHRVNIQNKGKAWHVLLLGPFDNRQAVEDTLEDLPESIKRDSPWIRRVSSVQAVALQEEESASACAREMVAKQVPATALE